MANRPTHPHPSLRALTAAALAVTAAATVAACGGGTAASSADAAGQASVTTVARPATEMLSANTATEEELQAIPGVGPEIAHEIVEYRPYDATTGPARFREEMAKYIDDTEIERIMTYLDFSS